jgi:hypothetical protein
VRGVFTINTCIQQNINAAVANQDDVVAKLEKMQVGAWRSRFNHVVEKSGVVQSVLLVLHQYSKLEKMQVGAGAAGIGCWMHGRHYSS